MEEVHQFTLLAAECMTIESIIPCLIIALQICARPPRLEQHQHDKTVFLPVPLVPPWQGASNKIGYIACMFREHECHMCLMLRMGW